MLPRRPRRSPPAPRAEFVVFTVGGVRFALPTSRVVAAAEVSGLNPLPAAGRPEVAGLVAHRGRALPLFDLGRCLGGRPGAHPEAPFCLVVEQGERRAAFRVDALEGLARIAGQGLPPGCETFDPARAIFGARPEGPEEAGGAP